MSERENIMNRLSSYGRKVTAPEPPAPVPTPAPEYNAEWVPTAFDRNVPLPEMKLNALQVRLDVLASMEPGDSFALPGHLADLYRASALKLRKQRPEMKDRRYAIRTQTELFSRMWRVA